MEGVKHLSTPSFGAFPLASAMSLLVIVPCAAVIHLAGAITGPLMAIAVLTVCILGIHALGMLLAWAGAWIADTMLFSAATLSSGAEAARSIHTA